MKPAKVQVKFALESAPRVKAVIGKEALVNSKCNKLRAGSSHIRSSVGKWSFQVGATARGTGHEWLGAGWVGGASAGATLLPHSAAAPVP